MLNMISDIETAMKPRPRFGMGACLPALIPAVTRARTRAVVTARPRTEMTANVVGQHYALAAVGQAAEQLLIGKQSVHTTLISASGAGAPGPHPAREPV